MEYRQSVVGILLVIVGLVVNAGVIGRAGGTGWGCKRAGLFWGVGIGLMILGGDLLRRGRRRSRRSRG